MALTAGELQILITANTKEIDQLKNKLNDVGKTSKNVSDSANGINNSLLKMAPVIAGIGVAIAGTAKAITSAISNAAQMEKYETSLKVMLGSTEEAKKRLKELSDFAAKTPFDLPQVVEAGMKLQSIGKYSTETLQQLGDLAAASGKPMEQALSAFTKLATGQKGMAAQMFQDLLISADDWQKATGKAKSANGELLASTEEMMAALPKILKMKGFSGMMEEQSKTFEGAMSNMKDSIFQLGATFGKSLLPFAKEVVSMFTEMVSNIKAFLESAQGMKIVETVVGTIAGSFFMLKEALGIIGTSAIELLKVAFSPLVELFQDISKQTKDTSLGFTIFAVILQTVVSAGKVMGDIIKYAITNFINLGKILFTLGNIIIMSLVNPIEEAIESGKSIIKVFGAMVEAGSKAGKILPSIFEAIKTGDFSKIKDSVKDTIDSIGNISDTIAKETEKNSALSKKHAEEMNKAGKDFENAILETGKDAFTNLGTIIKDSINEVKNFGDNVEKTKAKIESAFNAGKSLAIDKTEKTTTTKTNNTTNNVVGNIKSLSLKDELISIQAEFDSFYKAKKRLLDEYDSNTANELNKQFITMSDHYNKIKQLYQNAKEEERTVLSEKYNANEEDFYKIQQLNKKILEEEQKFAKEQKERMNEQLRVPAKGIAFYIDNDMLRDSIGLATSLLENFIGSKIPSLINNLLSGLADSFKNVFSQITEGIIGFEDRKKELMEKGLSETATNGVATMEIGMKAAGSIISSIQSVVQGIGQYINDYYNQEIAKVQEAQQLEITAIDEKLAKEIELIENNGQTKKQKRESDLADLQAKLATETDEEKRKDIAEKISALEKEIAITKATEDANKQKDDANKEYAKKQYELEKKQFEIKKGMDIANVWMAAAAGIVQAWAGAAGWPGPSVIAGMVIAGVLTGLIATMAGVQTGLIAARQMPPPPFASGGIVTGDRTQGDMINARLNSGEMVLNEEQQAQLFSQLNGSSGRNVNVRVFIGERELKEIISEVNIDNRNFERGRR